SATLDGLEGNRLVVKERSGAGSATIAIDVDREVAEAAGAQMAEPVFQPFVDGTEFSVDLYVDQSGACVGTLVRERSRVVHGESQITTVQDRPDIADLARRVASAIGIRGHAIVQVLDDGDAVHVLECNSRVGGASSGAWLNGLRTVDAMLLEALEENVPTLTPRVGGTEVVRIPTDRVHWL
ncbi:ATP-grasp domain-containing protein, partial [bacterium]|nr:ATP-grasp domain-containing protein [bacterium]